MATNTYTYGSLGQRWTVGETTRKTRLDISRISADANRWTLQQLITDPDNTANFAHGIKAVYTSAESTPTNLHNFINYTGASEIPCVALSTTAGGSTTLNGYLTSTVNSNTILWNSRRSTGFYLGADDKLKYYVSSAFKEIVHQGNAIITTGMIDATTLVTSGETFVNNDTTIPTSASVKAYADSVGGGIAFSGSTADGLVTFGSSSSAVVESTATYASDILNLTGNPYWALTISGTNDGKIKLSGANSPQIAFVEGATDRALVKWEHGNDSINLENAEESTSLKVGATIAVTGSLTATGDIESTSDERVKTDIKTIPDALNKVLQLRGATFIKDNKKSIGVIAQEIQKVIPEVVTVPDGEDGLASVAYGNIVGLLIEAIKEQQGQIDDLLEQVYA